MKRGISLLLIFLLLLAPISYARKTYNSGYHKSKSTYSSSYHPRKSTYSKPYRAPKKASYTYKVPKASKKTSYSTTTKHKKNYCSTCTRDSKGKIARSEAAKKSFMKQTGYPHGRPGYVVDHIIPLKKGGSDNPSNMQWQTKTDAKAKDKVE